MGIHVQQDPHGWNTVDASLRNQPILHKLMFLIKSLMNIWFWKLLITYCQALWFRYMNNVNCDTNWQPKISCSLPRDQPETLLRKPRFDYLMKRSCLIMIYKSIAPFDWWIWAGISYGHDRCSSYDRCICISTYTYITVPLIWKRCHKFGLFH